MIARKKGQHFQFEFVAQPPQGLESVQVVLPEAHHSSPYEHVVDLIHGSTVDTASDPHACPSWTGHNDVNVACCRNCNERWTIPDHVSTKTTKFQSRATSPGTSPVSVEDYWVRQNIPIGIAVSKTPSNEAKISDDGNVYDSEFGDSDVSLVSLSTAQNGNNKSRVMSASRKIQAVGVPGEERVILDQMPSIFSPGPRSYHIGGTTLTAYQTMQDESDSRWNDQGKMKRRGWHSPCPTSPSWGTVIWYTRSSLIDCGAVSIVDICSRKLLLFWFTGSCVDTTLWNNYFCAVFCFPPCFVNEIHYCRGEICPQPLSPYSRLF